MGQISRDSNGVPVKNAGDFSFSKEINTIVDEHNDTDNKIDNALTSVSLNDVTANDPNTENSIVYRNQAASVYYDDLDEQSGAIAADDYFGLAIVGSEGGGESNKPTAIKGSSTVIASDIIAMAFQGANTDDFVQVGEETILENGDAVRILKTIPLEVVSYSESAPPNSTDYQLTDAIDTTIIQYAVTEAGGYTIGRGRAESTFTVFNDENNARTIEVGLTVNDGAVTNPQTFTLPKKTTTIIQVGDSVTDADILQGDTVEVKVKLTESSNNIEVLGSTNPTTLKLTQYASLQNPVQNSLVQSLSTILENRTLNKVTANDNYFLPELSSLTVPENEVNLIVYNKSENIATILVTGTDVVNLPHASGATSFKVYPYESYTFFAADKGLGHWGVLESNKRPVRRVETLLEADSFNDQEPGAVDTAIQIEFGAAQGSGTDPLQIDANGTVTFNEEMCVFINIDAEYGRTGGAGESELRLRAVIAGVPQPPVLSAKLDDADVRIPFVSTFELNTFEGMTLEFELVRDPSGNNSGGLYSATTTATGWDDSPSARILINRLT